MSILIIYPSSANCSSSGGQTTPPPSKSPSKKNHLFSFHMMASSLVGAFSEQTVFHPVDNWAKRRMLGKPFFQANVPKAQLFYSGLGLKLLKKIPFNMYRYTVADGFNRLAERHEFGGTIARGLFSGAMVGLIEPIIFHPLDTIQVSRMAKPEARVSDILRKRPLLSLWNGGLMTALLRNIPGSMSLFGGVALADSIQGNEDKSNIKANLLSKFFGAFLSILVSQPADVLKTMMQVNNMTFRQAVSRVSFMEMLTKGAPQRLFMATKVGFGFFVTDEVRRLTDSYFKTEQTTKRSSEFVRVMDENVSSDQDVKPVREF